MVLKTSAKSMFAVGGADRSWRAARFLTLAPVGRASVALIGVIASKPRAGDGSGLDFQQNNPMHSRRREKYPYVPKKQTNALYMVERGRPPTGRRG